jgi:hypothetical protein
VCSEHPAWKLLIGPTLTTSERMSLITTVFSDNTQVEMIENLIGDDAQKFVDVIDEVSLHVRFRRTLPFSGHRLIGFYSDLLHSVGYVGIGRPQFLTTNPREMCKIVVQDMRWPLPAS